MVDETSKTISLRKMHKGTVAFPKIFNLIICTNGPFTVDADNQMTSQAFMNRTSVIMSKATKPALTLDE